MDRFRFSQLSPDRIRVRGERRRECRWVGSRHQKGSFERTGERGQCRDAPASGRPWPTRPCAPGNTSPTPPSLAKSKNKRRKLVEIPENLAAWLTPHAKTEGSIMPRAKVQVAMANAVEEAGIEWPHNVCVLLTHLPLRGGIC
jgi:hypothetical protein